MINKMLFVTRFLNGGGAERAISVLSSELQKEGYEIAILIYIRTETDYPINPDIKVFTLGSGYCESKGNSIIRKIFRRKRVKQIIKDYAPDVVIPFLKPIVIETYMFAAPLNKHILATVRNVPKYRNVFDKYIYLYVMGHCQAVFLQTEEQKDFFDKRIVSKSFVVSNPVDKEFIEAGNRRNYNRNRRLTKNIISAGRLDEQKNQQLLIKAMTLVHKTHDDYCLKIFGQGNKEDDLRKLILDLNAQDYISLAGRTNDFPSELLNSDIFVLSSNYEGMPNALMEAMATGISCVSTDCPTGPSDLLGENKYGRLSPVGDANELALNIDYFIENPEIARKCGEMAHEYIANNYSPEIIVKKLMNNINDYF